MQNNKKRYWLRGGIIGIILGIILSVSNYFLAGVIGLFTMFPALFNGLNITYGIEHCGGGCWGADIYSGCIGLIFWSVFLCILFFWLYDKKFKNRSRV
jgi:uncharacterized BrkB/YihY/UPF0761 family membrane protein